MTAITLSSGLAVAGVGSLVLFVIWAFCRSAAMGDQMAERFAADRRAREQARLAAWAEKDLDASSRGKGCAEVRQLTRGE